MDLASFIADMIPGVSTAKSIEELANGVDPITQEPASRLWAGIGLIPGGKIFKWLGKGFSWAGKGIGRLFRKGPPKTNTIVGGAIFDGTEEHKRLNKYLNGEFIDAPENLPGTRTLDIYLDEVTERTGKTTGAVSELTLPNGHKYHGYSGELETVNDDLTGVLAGIAREKKGKIEPFHGECAECMAVSKALDAGEALKGGTMKTLQVGQSSNLKNPVYHGETKAACTTCAPVLENYEIKEIKN